MLAGLAERVKKRARKEMVAVCCRVLFCVCEWDVVKVVDGGLFYM